MAEWGRVPWSLRGFVVVALAGSVVIAVLQSTPIPAATISVLFTAAVCFFLLRGVRWLWVLAVAFGLFWLAASIFVGEVGWMGVAIGVAGLVLLLHPDTRRFFRNGDSWVRTSLQAAAGLLVGALGYATLIALFLLLNFLIFHIPLSTR